MEGPPPGAVLVVVDFGAVVDGVVGGGSVVGGGGQVVVVVGACVVLVVEGAVVVVVDEVVVVLLLVVVLDAVVVVVVGKVVVVVPQTALAGWAATVGSNPVRESPSTVAVKARLARRRVTRKGNRVDTRSGARRLDAGQERIPLTPHIEPGSPPNRCFRLMGRLPGRRLTDGRPGQLANEGTRGSLIPSCRHPAQTPVP